MERLYPTFHAVFWVTWNAEDCMLFLVLFIFFSTVTSIIPSLVSRNSMSGSHRLNWILFLMFSSSVSSKLYWIIRESETCCSRNYCSVFLVFCLFFAVAFPNLSIYTFLEKTNSDSSSLSIELKSSIHFTLALRLLSSDNKSHSQLLCQPQSSQQFFQSWLRKYFYHE